MRGIDVASHQGYPNWGAVKNSDVHYAYIKASEGVNYVSTHVDRQWAEATDAGIVHGLYHFARPDLNGPEPEAELFARMVNAKDAKGPGFLPPCLDIEVGAPTTWGGGWGFITRLRQLIGDHKVIVYAGGSFYRSQVGDAALPPNTVAWIAHYNGTPGNSSYPTPRTVLHQYSDSGHVNGIAGNVDLKPAHSTKSPAGERFRRHRHKEMVT
jgi:GH25 family lysozyme M1 (1,4-beta-N-acetylmuramidase)